jgi:hypothetical protein
MLINSGGGGGVGDLGGVDTGHNSGSGGSWRIEWFRGGEDAAASKSRNAPYGGS